MNLANMYFNNAFLIEPHMIDKYIDFSIFPPSHLLYYYTMMALGYCMQGNMDKAKEYNIKINEFKAELDSTQSQLLPLLYIVGVQSYLAFISKNTDEANKYIEDAENRFTSDDEKEIIQLYKNRLKCLGNSVLSLETQHWIGTKKPVDITDMKGRVILLNFFTWNSLDSVFDIYFIKRLQKEVNNKNFIIIGVTKYLGGYLHENNLTEQQEYEYMKNHFYVKREINWPVSISRTGSSDSEKYNSCHGCCGRNH